MDAPRFVPDPSLSRTEMERLQREIAAVATFTDDLPFDPVRVAVDGPVDPAIDEASDDQTTLTGAGDVDAAAPLVAGVDQAFVGDLAVSAVIVVRDGAVVERASAVEETGIPYIPGLLSFREGGAVQSSASSRCSRRSGLSGWWRRSARWRTPRSRGS